MTKGTLAIHYCGETKRNYHGFHLKHGMYYGFDERGYFATSLTMEKHHRRNGGYYIVKMYRLDDRPIDAGRLERKNYNIEMNQLWRETWEGSDTTRAIIQHANEHGRYHFRYETRDELYSKQNSCAEVRKHSHVVVYH